MDYFCRAGLLRCIIYLSVQFFFTSQIYANYSFSAHFDKNTDQTNLSKYSGKPQNELEENMHACVEDLCSGLPTDQTYKNYLQDVALKTRRSSYFDEEILPLIMFQHQVGLSLFNEAEEFYQLIESNEGDVELKQYQRKILAFSNAMNLINDTKLPVAQNLVEIGPIDIPTDLSFYVGNNFDKFSFDKLVERGYYHPSLEPILRAYIENRNLEKVFPFITGPEDQFASLVNTHGKGAKSLMVNAIERIISFYSNPSLFPIPSYMFFSPYEAQTKLDYLNENFETLKKLNIFSGHTPEFATYIFNHGIVNEFFRVAGSEIHPDVEGLNVPERVAKIKYEVAAALLSDRLNRNIQNEYLDKDAFEAMISQTCRRKINYLYEALPNEDELERAEREVTRAIVKFQSWLFDNLSAETATSIFDFLRSWDFVYPPSKREFSKFLINSFKGNRQNWIFPRHEDEVPVFVNFLYENQDRVAHNFHGLDQIENFCKTLKLKPISDNTDATKGLVYLGWMTLKNNSLLESVVWHELGHIISSLIKAHNKLDLPSHLIGQEKHFSISPDSFTKYFTSLQCLGENQEQYHNIKTLGEPYVTWMNEGLLDIFKSEEPFSFTWGQLPGANLQIAEMASDVLDFGEVPTLLTMSGEKLKDRTENVLLYVAGEFLEEDWADLVAGKLSADKQNPFCFILKDQDHLFWNEKKGMDHEDIPYVKEVLDRKKAAGDAWFDDSQPDWSEADLQYYNANHDKHSTLFYRLLHVETVRSGVLPPSCQKVKRAKPEFSDIQKCDYF